MPDKNMTQLPAEIDWQKYVGAIDNCSRIVQAGSIVKVSGIVAEANGPGLGIGSLCTIRNDEGEDIEDGSDDEDVD